MLILAAFLAECGVGAEIEMRQKGLGLVIEPVKTVRLGWFDGVVRLKMSWRGGKRI